MRPFYSDIDSEKVVAARPQQNSKVKHTQGMPALPIEQHLARQID
jgi:hypothetical protein